MRVSLFALAFLKIAIAATEQEVDHGANAEKHTTKGTPLRMRSSSHHKSSPPRRVAEKYDGLTEAGRQLANRNDQDGTPRRYLQSMSLSADASALPNIYDTASSLAIFSTLVSVIDAAGKVDPLSNDDGPFTVFAPSNAAFEDVDAAILEKLFDPVWQPQLYDLLKFHLVKDTLRWDDLVDGMTATSANGEDLTINLDPARINENSLIFVDGGLSDVEASNGLIHGIDRVLIPTSVTSNIVDIAAANEDFSTLVAAVTAAGLGDALSGDGPLTVFAPTNAAFEALPEGTLEELLLPENIDQLTEILMYHVVAANAPSDTLANGEIDTLSGDSITINVSEDGVTVNDVRVVNPDVIASNGIIHIIDQVLLPPAKCAFCPNGLLDPTLVLPTDDDATCAQAMAFAGSLLASADVCETVQLAEAFCCPGGVAEATTATTTTEAPVTVVPPVDGQCACSPLEYKFELSLDSDCDTDTIQGKDGVALTFCFLGANGKSARRLRSTRHAIDLKDPTMTELTEKEQQDMRQLGESIEIISVQFLEFDTSGNLIVINQDDSFSNTSLTNGDIISFKSISNDLDPEVAIGDQLDYLPGGVQLTVRGKVTNDAGEESVVSNRLTWSYTNACDAMPIESGDAIGWLTTDEITPPSEDFCPAMAPPAIITTEAPPDTTEAPPAGTDAPPAATTVSPPDMSMPMATDAPPAATAVSPAATAVSLADMSMPVAKASKPMFGKAIKSKATKTKKPTDIIPKAQKMPNNDPMAKVAKVSSEDGQGGMGKSSSVDAKSGKSVIDIDTKAQKASKKDDGMNSGKTGKMSKKAGKSGKSSGDKSMDSGKSGKSGGVKDDMKGSKATKLFKKKMSL